MPRIYEDFGDGWQAVQAKNLRIACCDCGLVHTICIRKTKDGYQMKMDRDNKATALLRRHNEHPCK